MSVYQLKQWVFLFFIYCFFGWIWESGYKSIKHKKFINSGFLNGPWIPIYGFGAIIVLFLTSPFQDNHFLIFFIGMFSATFFELIVGYIMEKIFHVRYWDYSHVPLNLHGYICLPVAFVWGLFSLFLVKIINTPINYFIQQFPLSLIIIFDIILSLLFIIDVILSTIQALNLKHIMQVKDLMNDAEVLNEKMIRKAEKIIKRNPRSKSYKHNLNPNDIQQIIIHLKDKIHL